MTDKPKTALPRPLQIALGAGALIVGLLMIADGLKTMLGVG